MVVRFGWMEILIIVLLLFILFGHSKIPTMMKNLANGISTFKKEMKKDDKADVKKSDMSAPTKKKTVAKKNTVRKRVVGGRKK